MFIFMELIFGELSNAPTSITDAIERPEYKEFMEKYTNESMGLTEERRRMVRENIMLTLASEIYFKELLSNTELVATMMSTVVQYTSEDKLEIDNLMESWTRLAVSAVNFLSNPDMNKHADLDKVRVKTSKLMSMIGTTLFTLGYTLGKDGTFKYEGMENSAAVVRDLIEHASIDVADSEELREQINNLFLFGGSGEKDE